MTRRTLTPAGVAGVALAATLTACPTWTRAAGLDVWNLHDLTRRHAEEVSRSEHLDDQMDALHRRNLVKRGLVADLAAGRADLAATAAEFLALDASDPWSLIALRLQYPVGPDLKRAAQSVLDWAGNRTAAGPDLAARLDAEFRALYPAG